MSALREIVIEKRVFVLFTERITEAYIIQVYN